MDINNIDTDATPDQPKYYGRIDLSLTDDIGEQLKTPGALLLREQLKNLSIDELLLALSELTPDEYADNRRLEFMATNLELTARGVSPAWRNLHKVNYRSGTTLDGAPERYARDSQIIDLEWVYTKHHGHPMNHGAWGGTAANIFDAGDFDFARANIIASAQITSEKKAEMWLMLAESMQTELHIIKSRRIKERFTRVVMNESQEVRFCMLSAADRNRRRGSKLKRQIPEWVKLWVSAALGDGTVASIKDIYQTMTGKAMHRSTLRNKLNTIYAALESVNCKHRHKLRI